MKNVVLSVPYIYNKVCLMWTSTVKHTLWFGPLHAEAAAQPIF